MNSDRKIDLTKQLIYYIYENEWESFAELVWDKINHVLDEDTLKNLGIDAESLDFESLKAEDFEPIVDAARKLSLDHIYLKACELDDLLPK